jgi:hypothetical protein
MQLSHLCELSSLQSRRMSYKSMWNLVANHLIRNQQVTGSIPVAGSWCKFLDMSDLRDEIALMIFAEKFCL